METLLQGSPIVAEVAERLNVRPGCQKCSGCTLFCCHTVLECFL